MDNLLSHTITNCGNIMPKQNKGIINYTVFDAKAPNTQDPMVAIAKGIHLLPFRTEKLSPFTPMVLPHKGGRVGSCLSLQSRPAVQTAGLFY